MAQRVWGGSLALHRARMQCQRRERSSRTATCGSAPASSDATGPGSDRWARGKRRVTRRASSAISRA
eukprot:403-Prymnesium_polylepis.1